MQFLLYDYNLNFFVTIAHGECRRQNSFDWFESMHACMHAWAPVKHG